MNTSHSNAGQSAIIMTLLGVAILGGVFVAIAIRGGSESTTASAPIVVPQTALQQNDPNGAPPVYRPQLPSGGDDAWLLHDLLYNSPGRVIAQGANTKPSGLYYLLTYKVLEITLPPQSEIAANGKLVKADKAWRVVISGGPFVVADSPWILWVDGISLGAGQENPTMTELSFITNDLAQLKEGATLVVSLGEDAKWRETLPEKLHFNSTH